MPKVQLIIEVDDKELKAHEASLKRLGVAYQKVGGEGTAALKQTEKAAAGVAREVDGAAKSFVNAAAGAGPFANILTTVATSGGVVGSVLAGVAVVLVGVEKAAFDVTKKFADYVTQVSRGREETGLMLKTASALKFGMEATGGSFDQAVTGVKAFEKLIGEANDGSKEALATMVRLGIDPVKAAKNLDGAFSQVLTRIANLPEGVQRSTAAMDAFGDSGTNILPMLKQFHGGLDEVDKKARELGVSLSEDDVRAAAEFNKALNEIETKATAVGIAFGRELATPIIKDLDSINSAMERNKGAVAAWAKWFADKFTEARLSVQTDINDMSAFGKILGTLNPFSNDTWDSLPDKLADNTTESLRISAERSRIGKPTGSIHQDGEVPDYTLHPEWPWKQKDPKKDKKPRAPKAPRAEKVEPAMSPQTKSVIAHADALGITPLAYLTLLLYEGAGSLSTSRMGGTGNAYMGPMQMGPWEQKHYGIKKGMPLDKYLDKANQFLSDRGVTPGANLLTLYKAVNGGNVNVSENASDGHGTIRTHVEKMVRDRQPQAAKMLKGFSAGGKSVTEDVQQMMEKQSDMITKETRDKLVRSAMEAWKIMGLLPDGKMLSDFQRVLADEARKQGVGQPTDADVLQMFRENAAARQTKEIDVGSTAPAFTSVMGRPTPGQDYLGKVRQQLGLQAELIDGETRYTALVMRRMNLEGEVKAELESIALGQDERLVALDKEYQVMKRINVVAEARVQAEEERVYISREIQDLQIELANQGKNDGLKVEAAYLRDIVEMRDRELQAVIATNRAQLELSKAMEISSKQIRAGIYEHMAAQKTLNEGIVDGINGTYDAILGRMNEPLDKLREKSKGFLSFITEPLKAMQGQALNKIWTGVVDKIFPGMGSEMEKAKNPVVGELKDHTKLLEQIAKNTGGLPAGFNPTTGGASGIFNTILGSGGNGPGGTPVFNPNGGGTGGRQDAGGPGRQDAGGPGGGLFGNMKGMFGPKKNILTGKDSKLGGIMGGVGSIAAMVGGMIGGRAGRTLQYAGMGAQIGSMFGPIGAGVGAGVGAIVGLIKGRDSSIKDIRNAILGEYAMTVKDNSVLNTIKGFGEQYFGKGKAGGANAPAVVKLDESKSILRNYAQMTGQNGEKIDMLSHADENWSGNQFRTQFGGFRERGGDVFAGRAYVVGEHRPELFVPHVNGTIMPAVPNVSTTSGVDKELVASLAEAVFSLRDEVAALSVKPAGVIVREGAPEAGAAIANANSGAYVNDWRQAENFRRAAG